MLGMTAFYASGTSFNEMVSKDPRTSKLSMILSRHLMENFSCSPNAAAACLLS